MPIVLFPGLRTPAAVAHVDAGGQALERWPASYTLGPNAPRCFRGKDFAKLYDADPVRLVETARRLGVRIIKIDREGDRTRQHVDLVGGPMRRALKEAVAPAPAPAAAEQADLFADPRD